MSNESDIEERVQAEIGKFINEWPLYAAYKILPEAGEDAKILSLVSLPNRLQRCCSKCGRETTWNWEGYTEEFAIGRMNTWLCLHCNSTKLLVWMSKGPLFDFTKRDERGGAVMTGLRMSKLGQWPAQSIDPPKKAKLLGEQTEEFYKKGLTSFRHGFGLAALAYFRRVVEDAAGVLIDMLVEKATDDNDKRSLEGAKKSRAVEDKLKVAADALPSELRPGNVNPLRTLHQQYSKGLHGLTDDECLNIAQNLRFTLDYTFSEWLKDLDDAGKFRTEVQTWSDPSSQPEK